MPLLVRLKPSPPHLFLIVVAGTLISLGIAAAPIVSRVLLCGAGVLVLVLLGYPILLSTVLRVPVVAVDDRGIRFPLMGVTLSWSEVASAQLSIKLQGTMQRRVLLIKPTDPGAVVGRMRPWLRQQARTELAYHGTPLVLSAASLNRPLEEIATAIEQRRSASSGSR